MPIGPQWRGASARPDADDMEESLLRAMDDDPRLSSGLGTPRADNVLNFIQMTGLTTGRVPAAAPEELPDDPISFFEFGVRDVDGSGDPGEASHAELDSAAFHIHAAETGASESRSITELRQIIADLAAMESDVDDSAPAKHVKPVKSLAPNERAVTSVESPGGRTARTAIEPRLNLELRAPLEHAGSIRIESEPEVEPDIDTDQITEELANIGPTTASEPTSKSVVSESRASSPAGLAAARELLLELARANDAADRAERATSHADPAEASPPNQHLDTRIPAPVQRSVTYDDADEQTTHHGLVRRRREPGLRRWTLRVLILALAIGAGVGAFMLYNRAVQPPRAAYDAAQSLIDRGRFEDASNAFLDFAKRYPGNPRAAEALYMAGFALQLVPEEPAPRAKQAYTEAIELLRNFAEGYPSHEKTPRAETLMGVLYYKTGRYLEAINILGDPERRLRDSRAYLAALRTLGRSYAAVNQMDNARSAFMRAGALESNMAPDQDYAELAAMYTQLAERSGDPAQRRRHFEQAVEQWDFALQVPGLLRDRKDDMKLLRDVAASKVDDEFGAKPSELPGGGIRQATPGESERGSGTTAPGE
jgi:TolA-binding protein